MGYIEYEYVTWRTGETPGYISGLFIWVVCTRFAGSVVESVTPSACKTNQLCDWEKPITFPQCNLLLDFPEILSWNLIWHHWLSVSGNSKIMHCGILIDMSYWEKVWVLNHQIRWSWSTALSTWEQSVTAASEFTTCSQGRIFPKIKPTTICQIELTSDKNKAKI